MADSVVYFVEHGNLIKIGYSGNLAARLSTIPGRLVNFIPGSISDEARHHALFAALRDGGEWFRNEPPLSDYLASLPPCGPVPPRSPSVPGAGAPKRQVKPGAEEALQRVVQHHEAMRHAEEQRNAEATERAQAIKDALALGLTLSGIGKRLGVSSQRVAQMKEAK